MEKVWAMRPSATAKWVLTSDEGTAQGAKDADWQVLEYEIVRCLRNDAESAPLPCCKEKGHNGPCYFRW